MAWCVVQLGAARVPCHAPRPNGRCLARGTCTWALVPSHRVTTACARAHWQVMSENEQVYEAVSSQVHVLVFFLGKLMNEPEASS